MKRTALILSLSLLTGLILTGQDYDIGRIALKISNGESTDEIRDSIGRYLTAAPDDDALWFYMGYCYSLDDRYGEAVPYAKKAVEIDPSNPYYYDLLQECYAQTDQRAKHDSLTLAMIRRFPKRYNGAYELTLLANSEINEGKDSLAVMHLNEAITSDPSYVVAYLYLAETYRMQGNMGAFFVTFNKILKEDSYPTSAKIEYLTNVINSTQVSDIRIYKDQFSECFRLLVEYHPNDAQALINAGQWYEIIGDKDKSEQYYTMYIEAYPKESTGYLLMGFLYKGDTDKENKYFEMGLKRVSGKQDKVDLLNILAGNYFEANDFKNAYRCLGKALKLNPDDAQTLNNYAYYLSLQGKNLKKAKRMSEKSLKIDPDNSSYLDTYGWICYMLKDYEEAKKAIKRSMVTGGADSKDVIYHYYMTLDALGEKALAEFYKMQYKAK